MPTHRLNALAVCLLLSASFLGAAPPAVEAVSRGIVVDAHDPSGSTTQLQLYSGYHALVVGCGDYRSGWPKLPNPVKDAQEVAAALKQLNWDVELLEDPGWDRLDNALNRLITGPGREKNRAVLFWYSGHGYTLEEADGTRLGYIVPVDAPLPARDEIGFMRRAIDMRQIETIVKRIRAKHVLMVFDSCFSGAIFSMVRAAPSDYIEEKIASPVREFITAGRENEKVPDHSVFKICFLQGIEDGYADLNRDGYVTGEELGAYLQEKVINYSRKAQHPQFGKINNPKLDKGDFVFVLKSRSAVAPSAVPAPAPAVEKKPPAEKAAQPPLSRPAEAESQRLAYAPKKAPLPSISLREKGEELSSLQVEKMLEVRGFFDSERNAQGRFSGRLVDNGDETVTDRTTGLVWQKGGSARKLSWEAALGYLEDLNQQKFAGSAQWRMPTIEELASLSANENQRGLYIDPAFDARQNKCWSAESRSGSDVYAFGWILDFAKGSVTYAKWPRAAGNSAWVNWYTKDTENYVRAVQSLP